jgi:hypothetical protein
MPSPSSLPAGARRRCHRRPTRSPHATPPRPGPLHAGHAEQAIKAPPIHRDNRKIPERKISADLRGQRSIAGDQLGRQIRSVCAHCDRPDGTAVQGRSGRSAGWRKPRCFSQPYSGWSPHLMLTGTRGWPPLTWAARAPRRPGQRRTDRSGGACDAVVTVGEQSHDIRAVPSGACARRAGCPDCGCEWPRPA